MSPAAGGSRPELEPPLDRLEIRASPSSERAYLGYYLPGDDSLRANIESTESLEDPASWEIVPDAAEKVNFVAMEGAYDYYEYEIDGFSSPAKFWRVSYSDAVFPEANDGAAIQAAIDAAGPNGVVWLEEGVEYVISETIVPNYDISIVGNGATLKRADESFATLVASVSGGATSFTVDQVPAHWAPGTRLILVGGNGAHRANGLNEQGSNTLRIVSIVGNTVTVNSGIGLPKDGSYDGPGEFPAGTKVLQSVDLLKSFNRVALYGVTFDGNKANNTSASDWLVNWAVHLSQDTRMSLIIDCEFKNAPGENISGNAPLWVERCLFRDCDGSAIHLSTGAPWQDGYERSRGVWFVNNKTVNMNIRSAELNHSEGVITFSAGSNNFFASQNHFFDSHGLILGEPSHGSDDKNIIFTNNICRNATVEGDGILSFKPVNVSTENNSAKYNYLINGNVFDSVGDIQLDSGNISDRGEYRNIRISGNQFFGGRVHIINAVDCVIEGNKFYGNNHDFREGPNGETAIIEVKGDRFKIRNNEIYGSEILDPQATIGIRAWSEKGINGYRNANGIVITGNTVEQMETGIMSRFDIGSQGNAYKQGLISNNQVVVDRPGGYGICVAAGWTAIGNDVSVGSGLVRAGIYIAGIHEDLNAQHGAYLGGIALSNVVRCSAPPAWGGIVAGWERNSYNITAVNNIYNGGLLDNSEGSSVVSQNVELPVSAESAREIDPLRF